MGDGERNGGGTEGYEGFVGFGDVGIVAGDRGCFGGLRHDESSGRMREC